MEHAVKVDDDIVVDEHIAFDKIFRYEAETYQVS